MLPVRIGFVFHGVVFLSSFLDVRLDKRKGRFSQSCSLLCFQGHFCLVSGGIFYLVFFPLWNSLDFRGTLCLCVVFWKIRTWNFMTDLVGLELHSIYM